MDTSDRTDEQRAILARCHRYGLLTREENGGLLVWWPDEDINLFMPLVFDNNRCGVGWWLDDNAEEGAAARGIVVAPETPVEEPPSPPKRPRRPQISIHQLALFGDAP